MDHYFLFSEYIDYHLSPEPATTPAPNLPRIISPDHPKNVTAQLGSPVSLHCLVRNLQDKTVSHKTKDKPIYIKAPNKPYIFICTKLTCIA